MIQAVGKAAPMADAAQLRQAGNLPIQGTSADIIKRAMVTLAWALHQRGLRSRLVLSVHDSLVVEVSAGHVACGRAVCTRAWGRAQAPTLCGGVCGAGAQAEPDEVDVVQELIRQAMEQADMGVVDAVRPKVDIKIQS